MEDKKLISCEEAGKLTGFDPAGIHSQIEADIKSGCNDQNWNGLMVGRKIKIPLEPLKQKLFGATGRVIVIDERVADILIKLKMAVEQKGDAE